MPQVMLPLGSGEKVRSAGMENFTTRANSGSFRVGKEAAGRSTGAPGPTLLDGRKSAE